ncbi:MAG: UDP-3-O-[3-hydroxymyristoyl] glucosamine N-acyltransferase, LpxD, partial [Verrucomicrobiota bacterium]
MPSVSVKEIADFIAGDCAGDGARCITGVASLTDATRDQLSFLSNRKYAADLAAT